MIKLNEKKTQGILQINRTLENRRGMLRTLGVPESKFLAYKEGF